MSGNKGQHHQLGVLIGVVRESCNLISGFAGRQAKEGACQPRHGGCRPLCLLLPVSKSPVALPCPGPRADLTPSRGRTPALAPAKHPQLTLFSTLETPNGQAKQPAQNVGGRDIPGQSGCLGRSGPAGPVSVASRVSASPSPRLPAPDGTLHELSPGHCGISGVRTGLPGYSESPKPVRTAQAPRCRD